jgi:peroxiredoxin
MRKVLLPILGIMVCLGLFMALSPSAFETKAKDGIKVGDTAPDFSLMNVDGKMYSLDDVKDANGNDAKGWIVTFTCNSCPVAQAYESRLIALHEKMSQMGYPVVAIMPNDTDIKPSDSMEEMKKKNYPFVYLMDEKQEIFPAYGATRTPEIYLVDNNKVLRYTGAIDNNSRDASAVTENYVQNAINRLEKGESPDPDFTKAIGCSIKIKS